VSIAAAQYDRFKEQCARESHVFTFTDGDEYLVFKIGGHEVVPFWSSRSRLTRIRKGHPKYQKYLLKEMPLEEFFNWLPTLQKEGVRIGTNWSGRRLVGYDVEAKDLLSGLKYWMDKTKKV
jgi:hypothetical protein